MKGDVGGLLRAHNLKNRRATHTRERTHINGKITDTITTTRVGARQNFFEAFVYSSEASAHKSPSATQEAILNSLNRKGKARNTKQVNFKSHQQDEFFMSGLG